MSCCRTDKMILNVISLLLAFLIPFGIITSYHDIRYGKIRNKHILVALLYGIFINLAYTFNLSYLGFVAVNATIALSVSFLAWYFTFCTAGDSKLFFAYSFLVPLGIYEYGFIEYFPSATIIINTLLLAFIYFFMKLMYITDMSEKKEIIKKTINPKSILDISIFIFGLYWGVSSIMTVFGYSGGFIVPILIIALICHYGQKLGADIFKLAIVLSILHIFFNFPELLSMFFWLNFFIYIIFLTFLLKFIPEFGYFMFSKETKISELKERMMLIEAIVKKGSKYVKVPLSKTVDVKKCSIVDYKASGLTNDDINKLKHLKKSKKLDFDTILIQQTIPFAPLIFIGVLLTILMDGNIYGYLFNNLIYRVTIMMRINITIFEYYRSRYSSIRCRSEISIIINMNIPHRS